MLMNTTWYQLFYFPSAGKVLLPSPGAEGR